MNRLSRWSTHLSQSLLLRFSLGIALVVLGMVAIFLLEKKLTPFQYALLDVAGITIVVLGIIILMGPPQDS